MKWVRAVAACSLLLAAGCRMPGRHDATSALTPRAEGLSPADAQLADALAYFAEAALAEQELPRALTFAAEQYRLAAERDPDRQELHARRADLLLRAGRPDEAIAVLQAAIARFPDAAELHLRLATYAQLRERHDVAVTAGQALVRLNPTAPVPYARLAYSLLQLGRIDEARAALDAGTERVTDPALLLDTYPLVAAMLRDAGRPADAARCMERVLARRPESVEARELHIALLHTAGQADAAQRAADAWAEAPQWHPTRYAMRMGEIYESLGAPTNAVPWYRQACEETPAAPAPYLRLASVYLQTGEQLKAITLLDHLAHELSPSAELFVLLSEIHVRLNRHDEAVRYLEKACDISRDVAPYLRLGLLHADGGRMDAAIATLEEAITHFPADPLAHTSLGWLLLVAERHLEALERFAIVETVATTLGLEDADLHPLFLYWYGMACERLGRHEEAARRFLRNIELHPGHAECRNYLAYMWAEQGVRLEEALTHVAAALQAEPGNGAYLDTRGWIHFQSGRYRPALLDLEKALTLLPDDPVVLDHVGDCLFVLGRTRAAVEHWTRSAARPDAHADDAARKLARFGQPLPTPAADLPTDP